MKAGRKKPGRGSAATSAGKPESPKVQGEPRLSLVRGWTLREYFEVTSTNLVAANLPAWSAVRADRQTAGRGRFQRNWISDEGGLWLSAVVPLPAKSSFAPALPLLAGLSVAETLRSLGVKGLRLRWPNDVLVRERKLAGLLIDQFVSGLAVVGIGVNVANSPEKAGGLPKNQATRLADLLSSFSELDELAALVLGSLRQVLEQANSPEAGAMLPRINLLWGRPRRVELDLDGRRQRGVFAGVQPDGQIVLRDERGERQSWHASQVRHLTELTD